MPHTALLMNNNAVCGTVLLPSFEPPVRILIIDDNRVLRTPDGADVTYARNLAEARAALADGPWDQTWFDCDLGVVDGVVESTVELGKELEAACHGIGERPELGEVFVHSANAIDAREMMLALRGYRPTRVDAAAVTVDVLDW